MKDRVKIYMAIACFICSIVFGGAAFIVPPLGIIDSSVLWFTAQLLLFTATLLGMQLSLGKWGSNSNK